MSIGFILLIKKLFFIRFLLLNIRRRIKCEFIFLK